MNRIIQTDYALMHFLETEDKAVTVVLKKKIYGTKNQAFVNFNNLMREWGQNKDIITMDRLLDQRYYFRHDAGYMSVMELKFVVEDDDKTLTLHTSTQGENNEARNWQISDFIGEYTADKTIKIKWYIEPFSLNDERDIESFQFEIQDIEYS